MIVKIFNSCKEIVFLLINKVKTRIEYMKCFRVVSLKPKQPSQGNVLLSYRIEPFLLKSDNLPNNHTWYWECRQIAQTFLDLGYCVDVI